MSADRKILQAALHPTANLSVLLVSPLTEDQTEIRQILDPKGCSVTQCDRASEALAKVRSATPAVVICERDLPDGSWKTVLAACESLPKAPMLLVTSKNADESLWAEVLNMGGYDVLLKPFDRGEVTRVIGMAASAHS